MSRILGPNGQPIAPRLVPGPLAIRIMVEEIGEAIGAAKIGAFERKVRAQLAEDHPGRKGHTAPEWINAMARVIVDNDDKRADAGFRKGIRRIRQMGGDV